MSIVKLFVYGEFAVLAFLLVFYVRSMRAHWRAKALWALWLGFCLSKFYCYQRFGGHAFVPNLPEKALWLWNWAYSGAVFLAALRLVWWSPRGRRIVLPVMAWGIAALGVYNGLVPPCVNRVELTFADLPAALDGYRIMQVSDLHCSSAARGWRTRRLVETVNAQHPDLICMTGDYADGYVKNLTRDMKPLKELTARDGVWYVLGNHEYYIDRFNWRGWFMENGMRFLTNECVTLRAGLVLGGMSDDSAVSFGGARPDIQKTFAAAQTNDFHILMRHRPKHAPDALVDNGVDLQLSGHTHGGVCPGLRRLVAWHNGGFVRGAYRLGKGCLYVSSGAGQWAGFPVRLANPSELTLIVLRRGKPCP